MMQKALYIILAVLGVAGAALSVGMLIAAIDAAEWGRVVLYCVTMVVCAELAILNILKLKQKNDDV